MRFEDIRVDMAVRYVGCPPSVLSDDPLLAGRVTALWPNSFGVTFAHQRSYRYNTVAADMFEPLETVRDQTPSGGVIGVHAIDGMDGMGKSAYALRAAQCYRLHYRGHEPRRLARARSANNRVASSGLSRGTARTISPGRPSVSRLVASRRRPG